MGFNYKNVTDEIITDISKLELLSDAACKKALKACGDVYRQNARAYASMSQRFSDIASSPVVSVKKSKEGDGYFMVVKGEKGHASLWHLANDGYLAWGKVKITGNHFVDKAEKASEQEVNDIIDNAVESLLKG